MSDNNQGSEKAASANAAPAPAADKEKDPQQRRENPRARCNWRVRCVTMAKQTFPGRATNISIGGVQVQLPVKLKKTEKLYITRVAA